MNYNNVNLKLKPKVHITEMGKNLIVFDEASGEFFRVDEIGTCIITSISKQIPIQQMIKNITEQHDIEHNEAENDVNSFLGSLYQNDLLDIG
ncbi:PqqD family protein [Bacillaceae bacterium SIJ1]|uniref:PqqD family protein n=1 Tax=Litoribacterium kuwaitense TaxID=1398745 RepID=UPI0013EB46EA|nr:PqqD family protein [Litoribacterium kuwaitense]NGP46767.1 PqqD family protein [Litoribacterium kuwaitense]